MVKMDYARIQLLSRPDVLAERLAMFWVWAYRLTVSFATL